MFQLPQSTLEADGIEVLVILIESCEAKHHAIGPADMMDAIEFRMEQQGLQPKDMESYIGSASKVLKSIV